LNCIRYADGWKHGPGREIRQDVLEPLLWNRFVIEDMISVAASDSVATLTGRLGNRSEAGACFRKRGYDLPFEPSSVGRRE